MTTLSIAEIEELQNKLSEVLDRKRLSIANLEESVFSVDLLYCPMCFRADFGSVKDMNKSGCHDVYLETGTSMMRSSGETLDKLEADTAAIEQLAERFASHPKPYTLLNDLLMYGVTLGNPAPTISSVKANAKTDIARIQAYEPGMRRRGALPTKLELYTPDITLLTIRGNKSLNSGEYGVIAGPYGTRSQAKKVIDGLLPDSSDKLTVTKRSRKCYYIIALSKESVHIDESLFTSKSQP